MPTVKIYDRAEAARIINARRTLAMLRDDYRGFIRMAKLSAQMARAVVAMAEQANINPEDGTCQVALRTRRNEDEGFFDIWLNDVIDDEYGNSSGQFIDALNGDEAEGLPPRVFVNSPGGLVIEAWAIGAELERSAKRAGGGIAIVQGMAASAATTVALSLPRVEMAKRSEFMIHCCWGVFSSNQHQTESVTEEMRRTDGQIEDAYMERTGLDRSAVADMMRDETTMTARQAVDKRFADAIEGEDGAGVEDPDDDKSAQRRAVRDQRAALVTTFAALT